MATAGAYLADKDINNKHKVRWCLNQIQIVGGNLVHVNYIHRDIGIAKVKKSTSTRHEHVDLSILRNGKAYRSLLTYLLIGLSW